MKHYILMADIIHSTQQDSTVLMKDFKKISNEINRNFKKAFLSPITITLGDEFQSVVKSLRDGIDVIINFEELIIKLQIDFKLRYVLNFGGIDTPINPKRAYGMLGEGLTEAREMLGAQKQEIRRFLVKTRKAELSEQLKQAFFIYQSFIDGWKPRDYEIVSAFLNHKDYKIVARVLKKDISSMWRREESLKINEYLAARKLIYLLTG